jgi:hypothetical protein
MLVRHHVVFSAVISASLYAATDSWQPAAASLASGILIDLDHVIDYAVEYGPPLDLKRFLRLVYEARYKYVFYIFHAWEWFILGTAAAWATGWNVYSAGLLIGYGLHLALDQIGNKGSTWTYFMLWRWKQGFEHVRCFPGRTDLLSGTDR